MNKPTLIPAQSSLNVSRGQPIIVATYPGRVIISFRGNFRRFGRLVLRCLGSESALLATKSISGRVKYLTESGSTLSENVLRLRKENVQKKQDYEMNGFPADFKPCRLFAIIEIPERCASVIAQLDGAPDKPAIVLQSARIDSGAVDIEASDVVSIYASELFGKLDSARPIEFTLSSQDIRRPNGSIIEIQWPDVLGTGPGYIEMRCFSSSGPLRAETRWNPMDVDGNILLALPRVRRLESSSRTAREIGAQKDMKYIQCKAYSLFTEGETYVDLLAVRLKAVNQHSSAKRRSEAQDMLATEIYDATSRQSEDDLLGLFF